MAMAVCTFLALLFFWRRYSEEGMKMPAIVLALEVFICSAISVWQYNVTDAGLVGIAVGAIDNIWLMVVYSFLNMNFCILLTFNVAFYLAETRQKAFPKYEVPSSKSDRSFSFPAIMDRMKQNCLGANLLTCLVFNIVIIYVPPTIYFGLISGLVLSSNTLVLYYACRLWAIRDEMEKDTRRDFTRMVQWSVLSVLFFLVHFLALALLWTDLSIFDDLQADGRLDLKVNLLVHSNVCIHFGQVCVWGWPYERDLEREVGELTAVMQLFVHATAVVNPDFILNGDAGFADIFGCPTVELEKLCSSALDMDIARFAIESVIQSGRAQKVQLQLVSQTKQEWMRCIVGAVCVNGKVHLSFVVESRGYVLLDS
jgi:hypothetical protein